MSHECANLVSGGKRRIEIVMALSLGLHEHRGETGHVSDVCGRKRWAISERNGKLHIKRETSGWVLAIS